MTSLNKSSTQVYLPGLNGLRAIASLAVVISHVTNYLNWFGLNLQIKGNANQIYIYEFGEYGVTIFFTLSGFLITFLILKEKEEINTVKIGNFYIRRILRIWPLYYLNLIISIITILVFKLDFIAGSIPYYVFLAANIPFVLHHSLPLLAHYWSLGVEEQFYILFPGIAKLSNRKMLKYSLLFILFFLIVKILFYLCNKVNGTYKEFYDAILILRFHIMVVGVVSAIFYYYKQQLFLFLTTNKISQILSWVCIFLMMINKFHLPSVIKHEFISIVSVCLIMGQITRSSIISLENKIFDFIGKISYGIYVIHMVLIIYLSNLFGRLSNELFSYFLVYFTVIAATILVAWLSYEFYEKKFLKMKVKYSTVKSTSVTNGHA